MTWAQGDLLTEAEQVREEAIARVGRNADTEWRERALQVVRFLASDRLAFTTDDVWAMLRHTDETTHEPRALGAVMRQAARLGIVVATPEYATSTRPECHARPVRVWRGA